MSTRSETRVLGREIKIKYDPDAHPGGDLCLDEPLLLRVTPDIIDHQQRDFRGHAAGGRWTPGIRS